MTRYFFGKQQMNAGASCAAACSSAPMTSVGLLDTAALAVSFLFLLGLWVRIILPHLAKTRSALAAIVAG